MKSKPVQYEIAERAQNFRWDIKKFEEQAAKNESYFFNLEILKDEIIRFSGSETLKDTDKQELLCKTFSQIFRLIKMPEIDSFLFCNCPPLSDSVYEACLFTTLCSFLHTTKRIRGMSLRDFVLYNHPLDFNNIESPNFRTDLLDAEADRLRKYRNRLLADGKVYIKHAQWAAMSKEAEYEWIFYFALENAEESIKETFKRIGNLYTSIDKALNAAKDDNYEAGLKGAYEKFLSRLRKLKYENYLELQKVILSHISENKEYYGLNLYRLEKKLKPYIITNEVKKLLACRSATEEAELLAKSAILKDIYFPKMYSAFISLPSANMEVCAAEFPQFLQDIVGSSCLLLDELVEKGTFGNDWENLFRITMNEMAESVFYEPCELDLSVTAKSQEKFEEVLAAPVFAALCQETDVAFPYFKVEK